jgi:glycosyltransferase involved in cell wall biosynthesis
LVSQTRYLLEPRALPKLLSFVIAIYNEEDALPFLRRRLTSFVDGLASTAEIILVNDGSSDGSVGLLVEWAEADSRVRVLNLARNFGHQAAVTAGLDHVQGDAVVVMDADLQDPPEVVASMLDEYSKGFDVVYGRRMSRSGESVFKRLSAWAFYRLMGLLVSPELPADAGDFRLVSRTCLDAVISMRETHRFLRGMIAWVGFPQTFVPYARESRVAGETKYPLSKMLRLAWTAAVSFSPTPLRLSFGLGFVIAGIGMLEAVNAVVRSILGLYVVPGWSSVIIVTCLVGGSILISIGVLGEYVGRIFEAIKERPLYVIASRVTRKAYADPVSEQLAILSGVRHER